MATSRLTHTTINALKYEGDGNSRDFRWDKSLPGFGIRIYPSGRKAFVASYRAQGRKRLMTLGDFGTLTLTQARNRARHVFIDVGDGKDPLEARQEASAGETMADLMTAYIERHAKPHKKTWSKDLRRFELYVPKDWLGRKATNIRRKDVAALHSRISSRAPYEANRLIEVLRKMFKLARVWGFIPDDAPNPAEGIQRNREQKRGRWLTPDELRVLAKAIDGEANVYVRAAIWLYLLTGLRRSELLTARRDQIDLKQGILNLPDTKAGEAQVVILSQPAIAILRATPPLEGNPYVLPGAIKGRHLVNIDKAWRRIRAAAGLKDVRLHDLRRTVGSYLSQANVDLNHIRDALRHSSISTTITYARLGKDTVRGVMEEHGRAIIDIAGAPRVIEGPADG